MNIINIPDQSSWWTMNMLRASIKHMQKLNPALYEEAIDKEVALLRSFMSDALGQEAPAEQAAA